MKLHGNWCVLLIVVAGSAAAQPVYRCAAESGSYSQQPCVGGRALELDDARSDLQRREGEAVARRQASLARTMERERLAASQRPALLAGFDGRAPSRTDRVAATAKDKDFRAVDGPPKKRKAKRRAA